MSYVEFDCGTVLPCKDIQEWINDQLKKHNWIVTDLQLNKVDVSVDGDFSPYKGQSITFKRTLNDEIDYLCIRVAPQRGYSF
ncbi:hypothetical protein LPJ62_001951 [Coemansia sp. RSA 2167]|nr:hypothetical protein LPJ54_003599 [Coemansia sp. RSA 1824]KAJ1790415.1 hypothetical protein LPJ62_001951 [Coemansia sp. RSA 2167]KAJ2719882.1 hypothetical protein H4S00_003374 [Coemansia sp. D1744]